MVRAMARRLDLHGRTALVTGASSGIGRAIAGVLARDVAALVLVARRRDRLEDLAGELRAGHPALRVLVRDVDLTDRQAAGRMIDALEAEGIAVDVLVNNAGFGDRGLLNERPWSKIEALLSLNVATATFLIHRLLPGMIARGSGGILNIGSVAGIVSKPGSAVYGASKSYLNALSEALHAELAGTGVIVTGVLPGPVPTEFGPMAAKADAAPVGDAAAAPPLPRGALKLPEVFTVSVEKCAEDAVRALVQGRPRVVPGAIVKTMAKVMDNLPRPIVRAVLSRAATRLRSS
jgi:short-subunit dehydrogenase